MGSLQSNTSLVGKDRRQGIAKTLKLFSAKCKREIKFHPEAQKHNVQLI